jgi:hypothetical protein
MQISIGRSLLQITEEECKSHADMEWTACGFRDMLSKLQHTALRELSTYPGIVSTLFSPSVMSITPSSQPKAHHRQDLLSLDGLLQLSYP